MVALERSGQGQCKFQSLKSNESLHARAFEVLIFLVQYSRLPRLYFMSSYEPYREAPPAMELVSLVHNSRWLTGLHMWPRAIFLPWLYTALSWADFQSQHLAQVHILLELTFVSQIWGVCYFCAIYFSIHTQRIQEPKDQHSTVQHTCLLLCLLLSFTHSWI